MKDLIKQQTDMIRRESGMKLVTEARKLDQKYLNKLKKYTDRNNHTQARIFLSVMLENKKLQKFYNAMMDLNDVFGGFGPELNKLNQKMEKELYKSIISSIPGNYDRKAIAVDIGYNEFKIHMDGNKPYAYGPKYDKTFKNVKDLVKWLNKERAQYAGMDDR